MQCVCGLTRLRLLSTLLCRHDPFGLPNLTNLSLCGRGDEKQRGDEHCFHAGYIAVPAPMLDVT